MSLRMSRRISLAILLFAAPIAIVPAAPASAQIGFGFGIGLTVTVPPPPLPVYQQPPLPAPGYIWTPGYWAYGADGYYWVPGTWVRPPAVGLLWTPGYWGWADGVYEFHAGYWGPHVGFYGGINYGFGYTGFGYAGGFWRGGEFAYNSACTEFGGVHVTNVYNRTIIENRSVNTRNVSYNGPGGVTVRPTLQERAFDSERHFGPSPVQMRHQQMAAFNPALRQAFNHGQPAVAATQRPGQFAGPHVVPASAAMPRDQQNAAFGQPRTVMPGVYAHQTPLHANTAGGWGRPAESRGYGRYVAPSPYAHGAYGSPHPTVPAVYRPATSAHNANFGGWNRPSGNGFYGRYVPPGAYAHPASFGANQFYRGRAAPARPAEFHRPAGFGFHPPAAMAPRPAAPHDFGGGRPRR